MFCLGQNFTAVIKLLFMLFCLKTYFWALFDLKNLILISKLMWWDPNNLHCKNIQDLSMFMISALKSAMSYMQCTPPPPPFLDFFPKPCRTQFDCFPNLCCQERGKQFCRPPKRSIFALMADFGQVSKKICYGFILTLVFFLALWNFWICKTIYCPFLLIPVEKASHSFQRCSTMCNLNTTIFYDKCFIEVGIKTQFWNCLQKHLIPKYL